MQVHTWKRILTGSVVVNILLALLLAGRIVGVSESRADVTSGDELSEYMALLQHHAHKLGLAVQAKNGPLAGFYIEEVEETAELIQKKFPVYDKIAVGPLMNAMLVPAIGPLEKSIKTGNWTTVSAAYTKMIDSCNTCHTGAQHAFIKITVPTQNPFNQSFSPQ